MLNIWGDAKGGGLRAAADDLHRLLLESMNEAVFVVGEDDVIHYANPAADRMFGYVPGELVGRHVSVLNAYPEEENRRVIAEIDAILREKGSWRGEFRSLTKDGRGFFTSSLISKVAIDGATYFLCVSQDITERRRAERALRESEGRLELATSASNLGVWDLDLLNGVVIYSPRAKEIFGVPADQPGEVEEIRSRIHPEDLEVILPQRMRSLDPSIRERQPYEYRLTRPDGEVRWLRANGEAIFEEVDGEVRAVRYVGTIEDIHEQRMAAERLQLLTAEVDHRANNLMTVVQAAVRLTKADSLEEYRRILNGRIGALAKAHRLLAQSRWQGADLRTLVEEELKPYRPGDGGGAIIEGPKVSLTPQAAQSLSMALHELCTNAAKYGALAAGGRVEVRWRLSRDRSLRLDWRETGAKPPTGPVKRGFGLKMIEQSIEGQLGGRFEVGGGAEGISCAITIPAAKLALDRIES